MASNKENIQSFNHKLYTVGIEEEYMICDPKSGDLINKADEIMNSLEGELKNRFSYELIQSEIESNTPICSSVNDSILEVLKLRNYLKDLGKKYDYRIGMSGTHPTALPADQKFIDNDSYNWVKSNLTYYASRNITFSNHFHIAIRDMEQAVHLTNSLRKWTAPLLALSSNSPFFEGVNTEFRSARTMSFGNFPRTHIPSKINSADHFSSLTQTLKKTKSIAKDRHIWWKIRPHTDYGTIEFRMCDAQRDIKRVKMLAAICQALVYQAAEDYDNNILIEDYDYELLLDSLWKSCRFGLDAKISDFKGGVISMKNSIKDMINYAEDGLSHFGNLDIVDTVNNIFNDGTEYDLQMKHLEENNIDDLKIYLMDSVDYSI